MTRQEIVEGLKLLEDNMVHFDELQNDKGEWIDVHELLFEAIKALSQEPTVTSTDEPMTMVYPTVVCDDAVSREAVLEAVSEGCQELRGIYGRCEDLINALPSVKPQPCDDAISREAVLEKAVYTETEEGWWGYTVDVDYIKSLPPVTQKSGKWIDYSDEGYVECPFCGHATTCEDNIDELHYCFFCGAELSGEEQTDETDN